LQLAVFVSIVTANGLSKLNGALRYSVSLIAVGAAVIVLFPLAGQINPTTVALVLLLIVLIVATALGSREALAASILAMLSFNFFFLPPYLTFHIDDGENWIAFAAFIVTALVAGQLSTYAKRQAAESEERRVQIEALYKDLQEAFEQASEAEALRRSEQLKSSLLDAITHDLRTPLTSIKASATSLLESKRVHLLDDEAETELLEIIDEESDRLNGFIEGMVGLAQIESKALNSRKSWTTVQELLNSALSRAKASLDAYSILIEVERELPSILVDARLIAEVLFLLLDNAAKYSPKGSKIRIAVRQPAGGLLAISVEDQGIGIPEHHRETVFQKFARLEGSPVPSTSSGLGLGLAIARGIVESQGGHINVESGKGEYVTRFVFTLPVEATGSDDAAIEDIDR
jgi:K+-sensing histidine kinase KdpD